MVNVFLLVISGFNCPGNQMHGDLSVFFANDWPCQKLRLT